MKVKIITRPNEEELTDLVNTYLEENKFIMNDVSINYSIAVLTKDREGRGGDIVYSAMIVAN